MTAVNKPKLFWDNKGDEHRPGNDISRMVQRLRSSINEYEQYKQNSEYLDVHNYQFTPSSLRDIVIFLAELNLIDFEVHRVYETVHNALEFSIVLKNVKCRNFTHAS